MRFTSDVDVLELVEDGHERALVLVCQRCAKICVANAPNSRDLGGFQQKYYRGDRDEGRALLMDSTVSGQSLRIKSVCNALESRGLDLRVVRADPAFGMCFVNSTVNILIESLSDYHPDIIFIEACNLAYRAVSRLLSQRDLPGFGEFGLDDVITEDLRRVLDGYSEDDFVLIRGRDVSGIWWVTKDGDLLISGLGNGK